MQATCEIGIKVIGQHGRVMDTGGDSLSQAAVGVVSVGSSMHRYGDFYVRHAGPAIFMLHNTECCLFVGILCTYPCRYVFFKPYDCFLGESCHSS